MTWAFCCKRSRPSLSQLKMAQTALKKGELVEVFEEDFGIPVHAHHLVYPIQHAQWPRVEKFTNWLRSEAVKQK